MWRRVVIALNGCLITCGCVASSGHRGELLSDNLWLCGVEWSSRWTAVWSLVVVWRRVVIAANGCLITCGCVVASGHCVDWMSYKSWLCGGEWSSRWTAIRSILVVWWRVVIAANDSLINCLFYMSTLYNIRGEWSIRVAIPAIIVEALPSNVAILPRLHLWNKRLGNIQTLICSFSVINIQLPFSARLNLYLTMSHARWSDRFM